MYCDHQIKDQITLSKWKMLHTADSAGTAMRILERLGLQTSSSFVKICIPNFKTIFGGRWYDFGFYLETIEVC